MAGKKKIVRWAPEARAELRAIELETARRILYAIDEFLSSGAGDVKRLRPPRKELRLRVGDYRVFFYQTEPASIQIAGVKHRSQAYR